MANTNEPINNKEQESTQTEYERQETERIWQRRISFGIKGQICWHVFA